MIQARFVYCSGGCRTRHAVNAYWDEDEWTCADCLRYVQVTKPLADRLHAERSPEGASTATK